MSRIKLARDLFLDEYIPKDLYLKYEKDTSRLTSLLDQRLVVSDQKLRDKFGSVMINDWWDGGNFQWRGLRLPECKEYSFASQHSWGRASDKTFYNASAEDVRIYIKANWIELDISGLEETVSWVHSDVRWTHGSLLLF